MTELIKKEGEKMPRDSVTSSFILYMRDCGLHIAYLESDSGLNTM